MQVRFILFIMLSISFMSEVAHAETLSRQEVCGEYSDTAETIMSARLAGITMKESMNIMSSSKTDDAMKKMIIDAYSKPAYQEESHKRVAITEFQNKWYLLCMTSDK